MHDNNIFLTLTYDDAHLESPKLSYSHFQNFMKKLRKLQNAPMGVFVTGEYGEENKRPHWHAIIFNYSPLDGVPDGQSEIGDQYYNSDTLTKLWGKGKCNYGEVTFKSAAYVARYAAKKLTHGPDQNHDYSPISKKSSKHAIGKAWLEKNYRDVFTEGKVILLQNNEAVNVGTIPRYYEKWFKENKPEEYLCYVTQTKLEKRERAEKRSKAQLFKWFENIFDRNAVDARKPTPLSPNQVKNKVLKLKFKRLQDYLKL